MKPNRPRRRAASAFLIALFVPLGPATAADSAEKAQNRIFVSNEWGDDIAVFNAETLTEIGRVPVCKRPRDIGWGPDGKQIFVACGTSNAIGVVDAETLELTRAINDVPEPEAFAIDGDGVLYITNEDDALLSAIDTKTKKKYRTVSTAMEPEGVTIEPGAKRVWVTTESSNLIHVFEADTLELVKDVLVGARPRRVAARPNSSEMWVTAEQGGKVDIIDAETLEVVGSIVLAPPDKSSASVTPVGVAFAGDGRTAYVALGRGDAVAKVDAAARKPVKFIAVGSRPWNLLLDEERDRLYVANGPSGTVSVIDTSTDEVVQTLEAGEGPYDVIMDRAP